MTSDYPGLQRGTGERLWARASAAAENIAGTDLGGLKATEEAVTTASDPRRQTQGAPRVTSGLDGPRLLGRRGL